MRQARAETEPVPLWGTNHRGEASVRRVSGSNDLRDEAQLMDAVREGDITAYGPLYERHVGAAYNLARQLAHSSVEADDLVSEAFSKVLDALRARRGPDSAFHAYLLTALRHTAYDKTRRDKKIELVQDVTTGVNQGLISVPFNDMMTAGIERDLASRAFARLPGRWQAVLRHLEIEGRSLAEVARHLGLTANGVSALACRAREGLRQAYLQAHLRETIARRCRPTVEHLGAWTRNGLSKRETRRVDEHLAACGSCHELSVELAEINSGFRIGAAENLPRGRNGKARRPRGNQVPLAMRSVTDQAA